MKDPHAQLLRAALLGTSRGSLDLQLSEPLASFLKVDCTPEQKLLQAIAVLTLHRRASALPEKKQPGIAPAGPESAPLLSWGAVQLLRRALQEVGLRPILPEALGWMASAGRVMPPALLPELLTLGQNDLGLRAALLPVLGQRGRWLAAQNPDWTFAHAPADQESLLLRNWNEGTLVVRAGALRKIRLRNPKQGLALLQSVWASERARERAELIESLGVGLSLDDEPFLEAALDDRGKEVRRSASQLLSQLSGSALVLRMQTRLEALVQLQIAPVERFEIRLPDALDQATLRDGVPDAPQRPLGKRASWLAEMVARVPPRWWTDRCFKSPRQMVDLVSTHEWSKALLQGWLDAARRFADPAWAQVFVEDGLLAADLLQLLPVEQRETVYLKRLSGAEGVELKAVLDAADALDGPWSTNLSRSVVSALELLIQKHPSQARELSYATVAELGKRVHPEIEAALAAVAQAAPERLYSKPALLDAVALVRYRGRLRRAIEEI